MTTNRSRLRPFIIGKWPPLVCELLLLLEGTTSIKKVRNPALVIWSLLKGTLVSFAAVRYLYRQQARGLSGEANVTRNGATLIHCEQLKLRTRDKEGDLSFKQRTKR